MKGFIQKRTTQKRVIPTVLITLLAISTTVYMSTSYAEEKLSLPSPSDKYLPAATDAEKLGTNENGIGLTKGSTVPSFSLENHEGKTTTFSELLKQAPLVVVFYRGGWCPYCNMQIRQLSLAWPEFQARKFTPVLISADAVDAVSLTNNTYQIPFPVLSDSELVAHTAFNVFHKIDDETYKKYLKYGIDLEKWSGQKHHKIAVPSIFIVDENAKVQWAHTAKDHTVRPSPEQLFSVIDQWQKN